MLFSNNENLQYFRRLLPFLKREWKNCVVAGILMIVTVTLQLPLPLLTRYIIDHVLPEKNVLLLNWIVLGLLIFMIINLFSGLWNRYLLTLVRERVLMRIQLRLFEHIEKLSLTFHNENNTGYLLSRISNDVSNLNGLLADTLINFIINILTFCVGVIVIFLFHWKLALLSLTILPFFIYSIHFFSGRIRNKSTVVQESIGGVFSSLAESLMGIRLIKSLCLEKIQAEKVQEKLNITMRANIGLYMVNSLSGYLTAFIGGIGPLIVLWYGAREVIAGSLTLGTLVAFTAFLGYIYGPVQGLMNLNTQVQTSLASLRRIFELFNLVPEENESISPNAIKFRDSIKVENISFSYNGSKPVLNDVTLEVKIGQRIALVGKSGAGKTTLVNLLLRFYDPQKGTIYIDDTDIKSVNIYSLRKLISIVQQDVFLFSGSVKSNIQCGNPNASEEEIIKAARQANAHEFILEFPRQYDTIVGERGLLLSGGQRQRIALARTILRNPQILILDEATSEVDSESEKLIQDALDKLLNNRTSFIIAHRLSTVRNADLIIVIDDGRIKAKGNHQQLYDDCELYRTLCDLQFKV